MENFTPMSRVFAVIYLFTQCFIVYLKTGQQSINLQFKISIHFKYTVCQNNKKIQNITKGSHMLPANLMFNLDKKQWNSFAFSISNWFLHAFLTKDKAALDLLVTYSICAEKLSFESTVTPRSVISFTLSIFTPSMKSWRIRLFSFNVMDNTLLLPMFICGPLSLRHLKKDSIDICRSIVSSIDRIIFISFLSSAKLSAMAGSNVFIWIVKENHK